ncbi:polymer-forming cytoskeletal protein [Oxalobacteraceae bacterium CAVE-383]|nr:polymer-forming cytoskeletal protein [Oxalobacteraceae bacterium CAVE-383]
MLRSETLFGKRENANPNTPFGGASVTPPSASAATRVGQPQPASASTASHAAHTPSASSPQPLTGNTNEGSKLIVGPNIKFKGEICDCDTLVVEGSVEATMDSRVMQIAEKGAFKGSAGIDVAEIRGDFDGDLTVRQKLVVYTTGRVTGKIRYGKLVIEEGGQISGDVQVNGRQGELGEVMNEKPHKAALAG